MRDFSEPEDLITKEIIGKSIAIHRALGPGLLESAYEFFLVRELTKSGLRLERQKPLPVEYDGALVDIGFRPDLIVERKVIVEIKAVKNLEHIHEAQLLSYLKLAEIDTGLLINFHAVTLRNGIRRMSLSRKRGLLGGLGALDG